MKVLDHEESAIDLSATAVHHRAMLKSPGVFRQLFMMARITATLAALYLRFQYNAWRERRSGH